MEALRGRDLTRESSDRRIAQLAARQHGVFTRIQAIELGASEKMIRRRVDAGRWDRLHPGTFRLAGAAPTWRQSVMALCLAWGPGTFASHRCGAAVWRLAGFEPGAVELIVPRTRRRTLPGIVHRPLLLPAVDVTTVEAIPVTSPARTLIDIAGVAPIELVEDALDDALRRKLVSLPRLRWRLKETARMGTPGSAVIRTLVGARATQADIPQSVFETKLLRVVKVAGLPHPVLQHEIRDRNKLIAVVDFAFPSHRLAIEADGYRWHSGRRQFEHDLSRRNALTALGWHVLHVTWRGLDEPQELIRTLRSALRAR
jgi:very-short-patch-repair endonuclease